MQASKDPMLKIVTIQNPEEKKKLIDHFDPSKTTWLVSDLRSKFEIQNTLIEKYGFFEDESVLRVSELWKRLLKRSFPDFQFVSSDLIRSQLKENLKGEKETQIKLLDTGVFEAIQSFIPLYSHPSGDQAFVDWLKDRPSVLSRVFGWYQLGRKNYDYFINQNLMIPNWISGFLMNQSGWEIHLERSLIFDLGAELSMVEQELIWRLSQQIDIQVIHPSPDWAQAFPHLMRPYEELNSRLTPTGKRAASNDHRSPLEQVQYSGEKLILQKLTGPLAEVKYVTEKIRVLLDQGVMPHQVAVVAPDIEKYWPLIRPYFQEEGIPVAKDVTTRLHGLPQISTWIGRLRLMTDEVLYSDLEIQCFQSEKQMDLRFERFEALFSQMLDGTDLGRLSAIETAFRSERAPSGLVDLDTYIGWILKFWSWKEDSLLEIVLRELLTLSQCQVRMEFSSWTSYLEKVLSKKEICNEQGHRRGVQFINILSADSASFTYRFFVGLTESNFKENRKSFLTSYEIDQLARERGFYLAHPEQTAALFELLWLFQHQGTEDHLLFPATSLQGGVEAPHPFWLKLGGHSIHVMSSPGHCRWDEKASQAQLPPAVYRDLGEKDFEKVPLEKVPSLSASSLETYQNCPFQFFASRIFALLDEPLVDLELDQRKKGSLAHALFEKLTESPLNLNRSEQEIREILDQIIKEGIIQLGDNQLWPSLRERHVKLGLRFLENERDWAKKFPTSQILDREKEFQFYYDPSEKKYSQTKGINSVSFSGKIDRVDGVSVGATDQKIVLIDYKSSQDSSHSFANWLKDNRLQLGFYAMAFDMGLVSGYQGAQVLGAHYYILKDMNREKGMSLTDGQNLLFPEVKKSISHEEKNQFYEELNNLLFKFVQAISDGDFGPRPREKEICDRCRWRALCRAPHLM